MYIGNIILFYTIYYDIGYNELITEKKKLYRFDKAPIFVVMNSDETEKC